jgi:CheY-like chemotaxis protein
MIGAFTVTAPRLFFSTAQFSPRASERRSKPRPTSRHSAVGVGHSRRVLVVEDNLDAVHSLAFLLKNEGHIVEFAINGYVALDIAKAFRPDVVLLDLGLPGLDGYEVCRRLKRQPGFERTRIVAVTAYATDEDRASALAAGCDVHIAKPYDPQRLLAIVRYLD